MQVLAATVRAAKDAGATGHLLRQLALRLRWTHVDHRRREQLSRLDEGALTAEQTVPLAQDRRLAQRNDIAILRVANLQGTRALGGDVLRGQPDRELCRRTGLCSCAES